MLILERSRKPHNRKSAVTIPELHDVGNPVGFVSKRVFVLNLLINNANSLSVEPNQYSVSLQKLDKWNPPFFK